jgi:ParB family transcriptional regulator, chromosome partitioning protein
LSVRKDTVKAAETAAKSSAAMQALDGGQMSLVEAAALTEFEDIPGAVERLMEAAGGRRFDHVVAQLREERASAEAEANAVAEFTERGFTVLDEHPRGWDPACVPLRHLLTADGHGADDESVTNPADWAVVLYEDTALVDATTGEPVDEQSIDWDTEGNAEATPAEGMRHADSVTDATVYVPEYFCLHAAAAGLTPSNVFQRNAGLLPGDDQASTVDLDADAREAARVQAEAERAEAEKRERRKVIALNKLGDAATGVRRQFITTLLARLVDCTSWVSIDVGPAV